MNKIPIIPEPVRWQSSNGQFVISAQVRLVASKGAEPVAASFAQALAPSLGFELKVQSSKPKATQPFISFLLDPGLLQLGKEGYRLSVTQARIELRALQPAGLFYGVQSLRQLLPPQALGSQECPGIEWTIACVEIEDYPRFGWRGVMLDVCRHFMPTKFILKFIDLLALHKLNTFHWHLTEDQGWRIEIKRYPKLTEVGAWRRETLVGHLHSDRAKLSYDGIRHGGFYTQEEVREVVEYARQRYINVLPEIEMPGHAQAAIAAYPELGNTATQLEVSRGWGIHEDVFNVEEGTISFLQDVLDEVMGLFPSSFIHVGGDEVPKTHWKNSPAAQKRIKELGLKNEEELQSYFIRSMDTFLASRGRRLVGWDEILEGGLAPGATVMSWRGEEGGIAAANAGHDVVMAPHQYTYLDYYQAQDHTREPLAIGGYIPLQMVYEYEPIPAAIRPDQVSHILGTQAQLWTEYLPDPAHVEYMAFPRLCALAEVAWTPPAQKDYADFTHRLKEHLHRLEVLKVNYRKLD